jgi:hypothetical protein
MARETKTGDRKEKMQPWQQNEKDILKVQRLELLGLDLKSPNQKQVNGIKTID